MNESFSIFRIFAYSEQAEELKNILNENNIQAEVGDNLPPVDITFSGSTVQNQYEVRIHHSDFEKAEQVIKNQLGNILDQIDKDYYLFEFSNGELYEILINSDEWNVFDYELSKKILTERGKSIDEDLLQGLKDERLKLLAKPEEDQTTWIISGYIFTFLGGFLGIIIGYFLFTSKKTLPNGQKVYTYSENNRKHGKYMFYISLVIFVIIFSIRVFFFQIFD